METCAFRAEVMSVICSAYTLPCDIVHGVSLQMSKAVKEWSLVVLEATVVGSSQNLVIGGKIISFLFLLWSLTSNQNAAYKNRVTPDMKNEEPLEVLLWAVLGSPVPKHHYLMATITFLIDWETEFLQFSFFFSWLWWKRFGKESIYHRVFAVSILCWSYQEAAPHCSAQVSFLFVSASKAPEPLFMVFVPSASWCLSSLLSFSWTLSSLSLENTFHIVCTLALWAVRIYF